MKVLIEFEVDGATFEDNFTGEVLSVLQQAAVKICNQSTREDGCVCTTPEADDILLDNNGKRIGTVGLEQ